MNDIKLSPSQAVAIGVKIEEEHRLKIEARRPDWAKKGALTKNKRQGQEQLPGAVGASAVVAARAVGMSRTVYASAKAVVTAATRYPEKYGDLLAKMDATRNIGGSYREMRRRSGAVREYKPQDGAGLVDRQFRAMIWQQVRVALINFSSLPDASEVVKIVLAQTRDKQFIDKRLASSLKWLKEFNDAWRNNEQA